MGNEAAKIVKELAGLYPQEAPSVHERVGAYFWGTFDEDVAGLMSLCKLAADEPVAGTLYFWHCGEEMCGGAPANAKVSAWACGVAAEYAMQRDHRGRRRIVSYRLDWGRMAAHDGVCLALFGDAIRDLVPGVNKRAAQFNCRDTTYLAVRNHVRDRAERLIADFKFDMEQAELGRFSPDFRARYERNTGYDFPPR